MSANLHRVCPFSELPPGARKIVEPGDGRSIGVFNVNGSLYALRNVCPHKLAPLCLGPISGIPRGDRPGEVVLERMGEILRCPWHGWEFEIATGKSVFNPHRVRVKTYPVTVTPGAANDVEAEQDDRIETYPVSVQDDWVVLHLR